MINAMPAQVHTFVYPVAIERDGDEFIARCPDFPEVLTGGSSYSEVKRLAEDALEEAVLARLADGREIPEAHDPGADDSVLLPPLTAGRVLVDMLRRAQGISKVELAERMRKDEKVVRRILDGRSGISSDTVLEAIRALGFSATLSWR